MAERRRQKGLRRERLRRLKEEGREDSKEKAEKGLVLGKVEKKTVRNSEGRA